MNFARGLALHITHDPDTAVDHAGVAVELAPEEPTWLVQLRDEWEDRLSATEQLVALGQVPPERLDVLRAQAAWELEHPERSGIWAGGPELTREELADGSAPHLQREPFEPTPAEQARDLEQLEALAERRRSAPRRELDGVGDRPGEINPWAAALLEAMREWSERERDAELQADLARRRPQVAALRLRGLLRPLPSRLAVPVPRLCAREPRAARRRRRSCVGSALSAADPPREPRPTEPEPGLAGPGVVPVPVVASRDASASRLVSGVAG